LVDLGNLVAIPPDVIFRKQDYEDMVNRIRQHLQKQKQITVAETRDLFNTSRRYALALLEHLDAIGVTARNGDFRHLRD
jgi:selenocysteine-specific elongation factor